MHLQEVCSRQVTWSFSQNGVLATVYRVFSTRHQGVRVMSERQSAFSIRRPIYRLQRILGSGPIKKYETINYYDIIITLVEDYRFTIAYSHSLCHYYL
jgi:hypothetical protein